MASLNFITSNPVTDAYNARQQTEQNQRSADLQNQMQQASLLRTLRMAPYEIDAAKESLRGQRQSNDFNDQANPIKLGDMQSQADLNKTQAYVAGQTKEADILKSLAGAKAADAEAQVAAGTVGSRIAQAGNQAQGSYLQNLRTTGQLSDDETQRQNNATTFAQEQLGATTQAEENVFLLAIRNPEAAIAQGKAAGVVTTPEQEAVLRNPVLTNAAAALISQLRATSSDAAWRDAEFQKLWPQIASKPGSAIQAATDVALQAIRSDAPGGNKPFGGTSMDAQSLNILLTGDPDSPEYLAAYNLMAAPKSKYDAATGMVVTEKPDMSAYRRPGAAAAPAAAPATGPAPTPAAAAPQPQAGMPAPAASPQAGAPAAAAPPASPAVGSTTTAGGLTITQATAPKAGAKASTEDALKAAQLLKEMAPDVRIAIDNFDSLNNAKDQFLSLGPDMLTQWAKSPDYQRAENAVSHIVANNLYLLSGATITDIEARRRARLLLPVPGEAPASIADKKARIAEMVDAMKVRAGSAYQDSAPADTSAPAPQGGIPQPPAGIAGRQLQWNPQLRQYRDKASGELFDEQGNPVR